MEHEFFVDPDGREIDVQFSEVEVRVVSAYLKAHSDRADALESRPELRGWRGASQVRFLARWDRWTGGPAGVVFHCVDDDADYFSWVESIWYEDEEGDVQIRHIVGEIDGVLDATTNPGLVDAQKTADDDIWKYIDLEVK